MRTLDIRRHAMRVKGGKHLTQAGVELARLVGARSGPFDRVVTSTAPRALETAIAMGFAVDEQIEAFSSMPEAIDDEIDWPADFATWNAAIQEGGAAADYAASLLAAYRAIAESLPGGGAALIVHHGGIVEASAVACLPDADHAAWGAYCRYLEGIRLTYEDGEFIGGRLLRVPLAPED